MITWSPIAEDEQYWAIDTTEIGLVMLPERVELVPETV